MAKHSYNKPKARPGSDPGNPPRPPKPLKPKPKPKPRPGSDPGNPPRPPKPLAKSDLSGVITSYSKRAKRTARRVRK